MIQTPQGHQEYRNLSGQLHRLDGPAVINPNQCELWVFKGKLHRTDGPVIEQNDGWSCWYQNGKRHRIDGPAYIDLTYNLQQWYFNGKLHRKAGPATESVVDGVVKHHWYQCGVLQYLNDVSRAGYEQKSLSNMKMAQLNLFVLTNSNIQFVSPPLYTME